MFFSSSFAGTGGGSGPDGVRSGHSGDGGRATRRGGQAGRPGQTAPLVEGLRARALEKMPGGCRFGRAASNQMDGAVRAGEEGGGADAHSDRPEGFSSCLKLAESPTAKFHHTVVPVYNWTLI